MPGSNPMRARSKRGFTLLIAIILASVAAAIGVALASLAYKNVRISQVGQTSQYAFYTADTALECALYGDQQQSVFDYVNHQPSPSINCVYTNGGVDMNAPVSFTTSVFTAGTFKFLSNSPSGYSNNWFPIGNSCARVTVFKSQTGTTTYIYAEGLSNCNANDPRTLERGLYSYY